MSVYRSVLLLMEEIRLTSWGWYFIPRFTIHSRWLFGISSINVPVNTHFHKTMTGYQLHQKTQKTHDVHGTKKNLTISIHEKTGSLFGHQEPKRGNFHGKVHIHWTSIQDPTGVSPGRLGERWCWDPRWMQHRHSFQQAFQETKVLDGKGRQVFFGGEENFWEHRKIKSLKNPLKTNKLCLFRNQRYRYCIYIYTHVSSASQV